VIEQMTRSKLNSEIAAEREILETILGKLSEADMTATALDGGWSVKDILAHIVDWERRMVTWIEESLEGDGPDLSPDWTTDALDQMNEQIYQANKDRPLGEVISDFEQSYQQSLRAVERLTDQDLLDANRFAWREGHPMWILIQENTSAHYREHHEMIERWLKDRSVG
jgi:hypothetical protein